MNWIKQFVILFVFPSGLLVQSSTESRSKLQPVERYEFCVARNLSESSVFDEEDKERINKIVMETNVRMHELRADPANALNVKTMLRLFAAALACVVADCDSSVRSQREEICLATLEACAESLKETAGHEVAKEMKKIFSAMNREISTLDAIADKSAPTESKKKDQSEKETRAEKKETKEEKKEHLKEVKTEKKEDRSERESEVKERSKRAYAPPFRFPSFSMPVQQNPTLESIIADTLSKSSTFNNFFKFGLSQEDAVFYSRSMIASGLSGYRYDIIQEAQDRVSSALTRLGSFAGSNDYAFAIARSIASVIEAHDLTLFSDGLGIGSALIYQLDSLLGSNPSSTFALSPSFGAASVSSSGWGSSSSVISTQNVGAASVEMNPSYVQPSFAIPSNPQNDKTQFQNRLSYFLSQSQTILETFCSGPVPGIYEIINSAFYDYGYPISSTIATIVSNSLTMLPTEAACTQYAEIISEIVVDILDKNGLILATDPQTITNKISGLISSSIQNPPPFGQETFGGSDYQLDPSFSDFSYSAPEISSFPNYPNSGSPISSSVSDTSLQQQKPILTNSTEFSFNASPLAIQTSSKQVFPAELSSDGSSVVSPDGSITTNNSWVIVDFSSEVPSAVDQTNLTSDSVASPKILEPGEVIPVNILDLRSEPETKGASANKITTAMPEMVETTTSADVTTPVPLSTNFQFSTVVTKSEEVTTPSPQVALKDVFENPSKLSDFLMKEMTLSLETLNATSGNDKAQPKLPENSGSSTPKTTETPPTLEDSKLAEKSPNLQDELSTIKPSIETPLQQNGPPDEVTLNAPILDELSALVFADKVSSIVSTSIGLIRSQDLQFDELCKKLNELAPLVDIPPLDVFSELSLVDYLLHVLNAVTYSLAGEK